MEKLKAVSLFSGCGGMDLGMMGGFEYLGRRYPRNPVEIVHALDIDRYAREIFDANFAIRCQNKNIEEVDGGEIPPHHILTGGFPCQSFSIVAQNPPRLGYKDEKGRLFFEMLRILRERKPLCFIAENVKGILSANRGMAFPLLLEKLESAQYHVKHVVLDASDYGVPQKRERVFIVGFRDPRILESFEFPRPTTRDGKVPLSSVIALPDRADGKYYFSEKAVRGMEKVRDRMNKGRVQKLDEPCNTITAHLAKVSLNSVDPVLAINGRYRRFTPREAARIQSFPDDFALPGSDGGQYRAIGNAVPPVLMWHLTRCVLKAIKKTDRRLLGSKPFRTKQEIRSYNMSMISGTNTGIEIPLRKRLWSEGYRYQIHCKDVEGKPDIVFKSKKIAVFCDSAFWHGRDFEKTVSRIRTNKEYWERKIRRNMRRDKEVTQKLQNDGWIVLRFWDDQIRDNLEEVVRVVARQVSNETINPQRSSGQSKRLVT